MKISSPAVRMGFRNSLGWCMPKVGTRSEIGLSPAFVLLNHSKAFKRDFSRQSLAGDSDIS